MAKQSFLLYNLSRPLKKRPRKLPGGPPEVDGDIPVGAIHAPTSSKIGG